MICPNCGQTIEDNEPECIHCGMKVDNGGYDTFDEEANDTKRHTSSLGNVITIILLVCTVACGFLCYMLNTAKDETVNSMDSHGSNDAKFVFYVLIAGVAAQALLLLVSAFLSRKLLKTGARVGVIILTMLSSFGSLILFGLSLIFSDVVFESVSDDEITKKSADLIMDKVNGISVISLATFIGILIAFILTVVFARSKRKADLAKFAKRRRADF